MDTATILMFNDPGLYLILMLLLFVGLLAIRGDLADVDDDGYL